MNIRCADCDEDMCEAACDACHCCVACCFKLYCKKAPAVLVCEDCEQESTAEHVCRACMRCHTCCPVEGELCANCKCHLEVSVPGEVYCEDCACHNCGQLWSDGGGVGGSGESCVACETAAEIEEQEFADAEAKKKKAKLDD